MFTEGPKEKPRGSLTFSNALVRDAAIKSFARRKQTRGNSGSISNVQNVIIANSSVWDQAICQCLN